MGALVRNRNAPPRPHALTSTLTVRRYRPTRDRGSARIPRAGGRGIFSLLVAVAAAALTWFSPAGAYFSGDPAPVGGRIPLVRVGVAPEVSEVRLSARSAWYLGIVGSASTPTRIGAGVTWVLRPGERGVRVLDESGRLRGERSDTLFAYPADPETGYLQINGKAYRGECVAWAAGGKVTAVNVLDLESYLRAVLPPEMGPQPPVRDQALQAQAIAARSYTLSMMGRWAARGFDLLATVEDQVYGGVEAERPACTLAVEETRGEVGVHDGAPIRAFYSSTCGGHTAAPDEVWSRPPAPYLQAVRDMTSRVDHSFCSISPLFHWEESWTAAKLEEILRKSLPRVRPDWNAKRAGRLAGVSLRERSISRRASCLRLQFQRGHVDLSGDEIRWVLRRPNGEGLRSALLQRVQVSRSKGRLARVKIEGQGYGHGVGMCQYGAMGMAEAGYDHKQIIRFYYRGAQVRRFY